MNRHNLSWAVQYEISRYRSQSKKYWLTLDEYDHIFRELEGPNDKAWHVASLLRSCVREHRDPDVRDPVLEAHRDSVKHRMEELERPQPDHDPYLHLEKEEKCISDNLGAGLGLSAHEQPGYYGGQGRDAHFNEAEWDLNLLLFSCPDCDADRGREASRLRDRR